MLRGVGISRKRSLKIKIELIQLPIEGEQKALKQRKEKVVIEEIGKLRIRVRM